MERKTLWMMCGFALALSGGLAAGIRAQLPAVNPDGSVRTAPNARYAANGPEGAKEMVQAAREAEKAGNLDRAEQLARRAASIGARFGFFEDTPQKVLEDVHEARSEVNQKRAVDLLNQARVALKANNIEQAYKLVTSAEALRPNFGVWYRGERPEKLRAEIMQIRPDIATTMQRTQEPQPPVDPRTSSRLSQNETKSPIRQVGYDVPSTNNTEVTQTPRPTPPAFGDASAAYSPPARQIVETPLPRPNQREIGNSYVENVPVAPNQYLEQDQRVHSSAPFQGPDLSTLPASDQTQRSPSPIFNAPGRTALEQELPLVQQRQPVQTAYPYEPSRIPVDARAAPRELTRQPITATPIETLQPALDRTVDNSWNNEPAPLPFVTPGATPASPVRADPVPTQKPPAMVRVRQITFEQAQNMLAQARVLLAQEQYDEAARIAEAVRQQGFNFGANQDTPEAILEVVQAAQYRPVRQVNGQPDQENRGPALQKLAEARGHLNENRLLDSLRAVREAEKMQVNFAPGEDNPAAILNALNQACGWQMNELTNQAGQLAARGDTEKALEYLRYAQQLADAFQFDDRAIQRQLAVLQQPAEPRRLEPVQNSNMERFAQVEQPREFRTVDSTINQVPVQPQTNAPVRRITNRSQQVFEMASRSFQRGEFAQALAYLKEVNVDELTRGQQAQVEAMLRSEEMRPRDVVQVDYERVPPTGRGPVGRAMATDLQPTRTPVANEGNLLDEVQARRAVEKQRVIDEKQRAEQRSSILAQKGDHDEAINILERAIKMVESAGLDPVETRHLTGQLKARSSNFTKLRDDAAAARARESAQRERIQAPVRRARAKEDRKKQVADLMRTYKEQMRNLKYEEAEATARKAKILDPNSPEVEEAIIKARRTGKLARDRRVQDAAEAGFTAAAIDASESATVNVSNRKPVAYPHGFAELKERRTAYSQTIDRRTPRDRETERKLKTSQVSVNFQQTPLREALEELRAQTGVSIVADQVALEDELVEMNYPVTLQLTNEPGHVALEYVLKMARLAYVIENGIVLVTTPSHTHGKLMPVAYSVADLINPVPDFNDLGDPGAKQRLAGQWTKSGSNFPNSSSASGNPYRYSGSNTSSLGENFGTSNWANANRQDGSTTERMLRQLIMDTVAPDTWVDKGGSGRIEYYPLGAMMVVTQTIDIQEQVQQLLERLRELQDLQVTVEVRFITLDESFFERIGLDMDIEFDDDQTRFDRQVANNAFAPQGMLNEPDHLDGVTVGLSPQGTFTEDLDIPLTSSSFESALPPFGRFPGSTGLNGGIATGIAFLSDIEVYLFLEAAQGTSRANVMQAPKVTLFNGQFANLSVQTIERFVTDFDVVTDFFGNSTLIPQNQQTPVGTTLALQAVISADRRYVRLTLSPTLTVRDPNVGTIQVPTEFGPQTVQQPTFSQINVSTTVNVPDGGTVLMGGLKTLSEGRNEFGVPILNKIPYINRLFKNVGYGRESRSLLIMVTPRIIIPEEEEDRLGSG